MRMTNIEIIFSDETHITVYADTERFGAREIMCQCGSFREAYDFIKRETGRDSLTLSGCVVDSVVDWTGMVRPAVQYVLD
jgi:hypothetical protein